MSDILAWLQGAMHGESAQHSPGTTAAIEAMRDAIIEIKRLTNEVMEQARLNGMGGERELALRAEIERLQSCLYAQESIPQLYAEIKRLRSVCDAAFYEMCAYRDNSDEEVFQDAIDALGAALKKPTP